MSPSKFALLHPHLFLLDHHYLLVLNYCCVHGDHVPHLPLCHHCLHDHHRLLFLHYLHPHTFTLRGVLFTLLLSTRTHTYHIHMCIHTHAHTMGTHTGTDTRLLEKCGWVMHVYSIVLEQKDGTEQNVGLFPAS